MAIWKEIRKMINSTVGTKDLKPLDQIIRDSYYVYASDDLLKILYSKSYTNASYIALTNIGTVGVSGVMRIKIVAEGSGITECFYLSKNGVTEKITFSGGTAVKDLEVNKNDIIQFGFANNNGYLSSLKITAHGLISSAPDTGIFIE